MVLWQNASTTEISWLPCAEVALNIVTQQLQQQHKEDMEQRDRHHKEALDKVVTTNRASPRTSTTGRAVHGGGSSQNSVAGELGDAGGEGNDDNRKRSLRLVIIAAAGVLVFAIGRASK